MNLWKASLLQHDGSPPFEDHTQLYATIDAITHGGDVNWECLTMRYTGEPPKTVGDHSWMDVEHEVWFRDPLKVVHNMLANPDFNGEIDWAPFREVIEEDGERTYRFKDLMSGVWAWEQAVSPSQCISAIQVDFLTARTCSDRTLPIKTRPLYLSSLGATRQLFLLPLAKPTTTLCISLSATSPIQFAELVVERLLLLDF